MFTDEDFEIMEEAIDAWIDKDAAGEILGSVMAAMLAPKDDPNGRMKMESDMETRSVKAKEAKALRKRKATLLKAKLYEMAAKAGAEDITQRITTDSLAG
jgi:hypothetical protein